VQIVEGIRAFEASQDDGQRVKIVFLCSPGNPTGTQLDSGDILDLCAKTACLVVVDEAYIDFASSPSMTAHLLDHSSRMVVAQTLSKSYGLAGIRFVSSPPSDCSVGLGMAHARVLHHLKSIKPPYNVPTPSAYLASQALSPLSVDKMRLVVEEIKVERKRLLTAILGWPLVDTVRGGVDANFVLVRLRGVGDKTRNQVAVKVYERMAKHPLTPIVVRFRGAFW
jgi:histidinol-phosphate aminotransferase